MLAETVAERGPAVTAAPPPRGGAYVSGWQPKFAVDASSLAASLPDDGLDLTGLVGALERQPTIGTPRSCHVAEFTQSMDPGQTAVAGYLRQAPTGGAAQFWVLGASAGQTRRICPLRPRSISAVACCALVPAISSSSTPGRPRLPRPRGLCSGGFCCQGG
jgi:hypothetical protein